MLHLLHSIRAEFDAAAQMFPKLFHAVIKRRRQDQTNAKTYQHYVCVLAADTMWPQTFIVPNEGREGVEEHGSVCTLSHDPAGGESETAHIASGERYWDAEQSLEVLGAKAYERFAEERPPTKGNQPVFRQAETGIESVRLALAWLCLFTTPQRRQSGLGGQGV